MGLKTAILRVSKKWKGGRGSVCYGKLLEKIRNDCVHILILSHGTVFEWTEVWCLKILVVSKFQEILFL